MSANKMTPFHLTILLAAGRGVQDYPNTVTSGEYEADLIKMGLIWFDNGEQVYRITAYGQMKLVEILKVLNVINERVTNSFLGKDTPNETI